jgi:hypothetical protein
MSMSSIITSPAIQPLSMSSREIAELCVKQHQHVRRDITQMLAELGEDASNFGRIYLDQSNRQQEEFHLPKNLTLTLVSGYNVQVHKRIIDRWMELEAERAPFDPATLLNNPAIMHGLLLAYTEKVLALESEVDSMRDDVAAHERLTKADGSLSTPGAISDGSACARALDPQAAVS